MNTNNPQGIKMSDRKNEKQSQEQQWNETLASEESISFLNSKKNEILEKLKNGTLKPLNKNQDSE